MAAVTFAERIEIELRGLVGTQRLVDMSNAADPGTTENTTRTSAFSRNAAAWVATSLGDVGEFDDTDLVAGDQEALQLGVRWAWLMYRTAFQRVEAPDATDERRELRAELEHMQAVRVSEASVPQIAKDH